MSLIPDQDSVSPKEPELPEKGELGKFSNWAVAIGGTVTAAFAQSLPTSQMGDDLMLPKGLVTIFITIFLLLFVSTRDRHIGSFTRVKVLVVSIAAVILFLVNLWASDNLSAPGINPPKRLIGMGSDPVALRPEALQAKQRLGITAEELLPHFHYDPTKIWTEKSLNNSRLLLDILYIIGTLALSLSLIAAFDVYKGQTLPAKKRKNIGKSFNGIKRLPICSKSMTKNLFRFSILLIGTVLWFGCTAPINAPATGAELCVKKSITFPTLPKSPILLDSAWIHLASCSTDTVFIDTQIINQSVFRIVTPLAYPIRIPPGDTLFEQVQYAPIDSVPIMGSDIIHSNAGTVSVTLLGGGIGQSRLIQVPSSINVGIARLGVCEDTLLGQILETLIWIHSNGSESLHFISASATTPFMVDVSTPKIIKSGDSTAIRIRFCPKTLGEGVGTLSIVSDAMGLDSLKIVVLKGNGVVYIPSRNSTWLESEDDGKNTRFVTKIVSDSNSHLIKGTPDTPDIMYVRGKQSVDSMETLDTAFYVSTLDTSKVMFFVNTPFPFDSVLTGELRYQNRWLPFPLDIKQNVNDTIILLSDTINPTILVDLVSTKPDIVRVIGGKKIYFHQAFWSRMLLHGSDTWYERQAILSYASHFGMIFIDNSSEFPKVGKPRNVSRTLDSYIFR